VASVVPILQPSHEDGVEYGTGDHSELARHRYRARELPVGYSYTHTALDDSGQRDFSCHDFGERAMEDMKSANLGSFGGQRCRANHTQL
jgi:hypothetical protein